MPGAKGGLATDWEVSEDNLVYTFTLREDVSWTDGTPLTANDYAYHWEMINDEATQSPFAYLTDSIEAVEVIDDYTLEITFATPDCTALNDAGSLEIVPAHFLSQFEASELPDLEWNLAPDITSGQFTFGEYRPGEITTLLGNDTWPDNELGYSNPDGYIQVVAADQTVLIEQFFADEINFMRSVPVNRQQDVRDDEQSVVFEYPGRSWDYVGLNLADPENPQPALDEDGNRIDQGLNPYFSDKNVRHALGHAIDVDAIIEGAVFGEGSRMAAHIIPASWAAHPDLEPRSFDPDLARELLEEAGWVDIDDDGVRECQGCLYATENAEFEGEEFEFTLYSNTGNTRREAIGTIIQDELAEVGITVDFQTIEFNTLLEIMDAQTFDAFILGWRNGYPDDPDTTQLFGANADVPGSGFNFTSFYSERFNELEAEAKSVPGCAQEDRAPLYYEMQEIMFDEMPYIWLFSQNGMYAWRDYVTGPDPFAGAPDWNIDTWTVANP